jgi:hypothetical protein
MVATGDSRAQMVAAGPEALPSNRDRLLKTLSRGGIPAGEEIIRAINSWLEDAERLAQMK